jgi:hypothetical protein
MVSISPRGGAGSGYAHSGEWQEVDTPTQDRGRKWIHQLKGKGRKWARPCKEGQEVDTPTQERGRKWIHPLRIGAGSGYTNSRGRAGSGHVHARKGRKWIHPLRRGAGSGYTHSGVAGSGYTHKWMCCSEEGNKKSSKYTHPLRGGYELARPCKGGA